MHDPRPAALVALWEGAVSHLEFEMRMVHLRIEHPAVMNRLREPEKPRSALYLAEPFTPTDLMELIAALHAAGVGDMAGHLDASNGLGIRGLAKKRGNRYYGKCGL